eukprot:TRINITY_DN4591_c0_g1_i1.p1 TRINITY_DN4591_c0_g1~~TRINITY_DN4591_c0_g1_i1.p1  ORF type:complete len:790 (+),score=192.60 TRINITY_DN4591_c0_g1_i1:134-2503(+)
MGLLADSPSQSSDSPVTADLNLPTEHEPAGEHLQRSLSAHFLEFRKTKPSKFSVRFKAKIGQIKGFFRLRLNYYPLHLLYFAVCCLIGGAIIFGIEGNVTYIDALFMSTSAMCITGLATLDVSTFRLGSQIVLFFLMFFGGQVLMSIIPMLVRRFFFRRYVNHFMAEVSKQGELFIVNVDGRDRIVTPRPENLLKGELAVEYVALGRLVITVVCYLLGLLGLAIAIMIIYLFATTGVFDILERNGGISRVWFAFYHTIASFNNAGLTLLADGMAQFQSNGFVLIYLSILTLLGNTLYPCALRGIIVLLHRWSKHRSPTSQGTMIWKYILDHPRRCMTHLFPSYETKWLLLLALGLPTIEFTAFEALNWQDIDASVATKLNIGQFQSIATRNSGFQCIDFSILSPAMWVLWVMLMYLSVYPIKLFLYKSAASRTGAEDDENVWYPKHAHKRSLLSSAQKFMLRDVFWLFLALFVICIIENRPLMTERENWDVFKILFEIVSAYGGVGISLGYAGTPTSFSAQWHPLSKFIVILVMLFGRHRGLPDSVDRAVSFPTTFKFRPVFLRKGLKSRPRPSMSIDEPAFPREDLGDIEHRVVERRSFAVTRHRKPKEATLRWRSNSDTEVLQHGPQEPSAELAELRLQHALHRSEHPPSSTPDNATVVSDEPDELARTSISSRPGDIGMAKQGSAPVSPSTRSRSSSTSSVSSTGSYSSSDSSASDAEEGPVAVVEHEDEYPPPPANAPRLSVEEVASNAPRLSVEEVASNALRLSVEEVKSPAELATSVETPSDA